ncbi:hypothetical protein EXIGLDRAFT_719439 [Exidia glandulosa HHB12029]|uniref:Uncharacterized protein n=1 Tax=Exidia glandulosa HHB12029 TaxID=1314781 RepID=A0A165H108_EXIGL|nr:hypothetical protein EXIGLDRAFT_719439 [Exidia glandulosa HHB12029]
MVKSRRRREEGREQGDNASVSTTRRANNRGTSPSPWSRDSRCEANTGRNVGADVEEGTMGKEDAVLNGEALSKLNTDERKGSEGGQDERTNLYQQLTRSTPRCSRLRHDRRAGLAPIACDRTIVRPELFGWYTVIEGGPRNDDAMCSELSNTCWVKCQRGSVAPVTVHSTSVNQGRELQATDRLLCIHTDGAADPGR